MHKFEENGNNYSSDCVFSYFPVEWVDASRQSPAIYLATDLLELGRLCKWALKRHLR